MFVLIAVVALAVLQPLAFGLVGAEFSLSPGGISLPQLFATAWASSLAFLFATYVCVRHVDRSDWSLVWMHSEAALPGKLGRAAVLGLVAVGLPAAILLAGGWSQVVDGEPGSWWLAAAQITLVLVPAAFAEELMVRGYPFAVLRETWNWKVALVITSAVFALLHLANLEFVDSTTVGAQGLGMVFFAGLFLGTILVVFRSLYAAWLSHLAWNWVLAAVLHAEVSGIPFPTPGYRVTAAGPDWVTGGGWGPEGGAAAALGVAAGFAYLYVRGRRGSK